MALSLPPAPAHPATPQALWIGFHALLLVLLAAELAFSRIGLGRLNPQQRAKRQQRNALAATLMWAAAAAGLALYIHLTLHGSAATQFLAGYALEESLSIDNLFLFLLLFRVFTIPPASQPRALFWGVLGAILMRAAFILAGIGLLARFEWIGYLFGAVLLAAAVRLILPSDQTDSDKTDSRGTDSDQADNHQAENHQADSHQTAAAAAAEPAKPPRWLRWITRIHPVSQRKDVFFTREDGTAMITMLTLSVLAIECTDVVFALDSIPAVLSITREPFLAYSSNILAVMSLRSLYFLLASALKKLRFLHFGLAAILAFAGAKMLLANVLDIGPLASLAVIVALLGVTIAASLARPNPSRP